MTAASYAAVDWGTTSFRLWLVGENGDMLAERRSHEGMTTAAKTGFSPILESHLAAVGAPAHLPVVICGMAGARQGWVEAGYLDTPAPLSGIVGAAVIVSDPNRDIRILPGLAQRSEEHPDVMRGEETQLLGAADTLGNGNHIVFHDSPGLFDGRQFDTEVRRNFCSQWTALDRRFVFGECLDIALDDAAFRAGGGDQTKVDALVAGCFAGCRRSLDPTETENVAFHHHAIRAGGSD